VRTRLTGITTALLVTTVAVGTMLGVHVADSGQQQVRVTAGNTPWPKAAVQQSPAGNTPWPAPSVKAA
jgi:hypothetical protein